MALEHVDVAERATVVMALQAHKQGLRVTLEKSGMLKSLGQQARNARAELARVDAMIKAYTNKWIYLSDDVLDLTKFYKDELIKLPEWVKALKQLQEYSTNAVVLEDGGTAVDYQKTELLRRLIAELTAGGAL